MNPRTRVKWAISQYALIPLENDLWTMQRTAEICNRQRLWFAHGVLMVDGAAGVLCCYWLAQPDIAFAIAEA